MTMTDQSTTIAKPPRQPLGRRNPAEVAQTTLRIVGKESKTPALDVAAFQSFAE